MVIGYVTEMMVEHGTPAGDEREPIAVLCAEEVVEGWTQRHDGRLSDVLVDAREVRVEQSASHADVDGWRVLDLDTVIAVVPAPRPPSPKRVPRRRHRVEVDAGPYRVIGVAHLPVGADPVRYVASTGRRWLPLTDCTVTAGDDAWQAGVVIVNLDHASRRVAPNTSPRFG